MLMEVEGRVRREARVACCGTQKVLAPEVLTDRRRSASGHVYLADWVDVHRHLLVGSKQPGQLPSSCGSPNRSDEREPGHLRVRHDVFRERFYVGVDIVQPTERVRPRRDTGAIDKNEGAVDIEHDRNWDLLDLRHSLPRDVAR